MIVSASRRTDLAAFYPDWLLGRIAAGYCLVRNPYDARSLRRVDLGPDAVDFMVLWTRDPRPLAPRLREIEGRGIRFYVQMTVVDYPRAIEPGRPGIDEAVDALRDLSDRIGPARALWRYDPVILAGELDPGFHLRAFERISGRLEGCTERVTLSVVDEYSATASRLASAGFPGASFDVSAYESLLGELAAIARSRGMVPQSCAEAADLRGSGIGAGACVDLRLAISLWPELAPRIAPAPRGGGGSAAPGELDFGLSSPPAPEPRRGDPGQRRACLCARSVDIGAYGTCPRGCAYCYANRGRGKLLPRDASDEAL